MSSQIIKMKNLFFKSLIIIGLVIGLALTQRCKDHQSLDTSNHFIDVSKSKIELETDSNNIQLKAPGLGGFSKCKPYFAWRHEGVKKWNEDFSSGIKKENISENETHLMCEVGPVVASVYIKRLEDNIIEFSGSIKNKSSRIIEMARFHYIHGNTENDQGNFFGNMPEHFRQFKKTDTLPAPRSAFENMWKGPNVNFPMLPNPIHDESNWAVSRDFGIFSDALNKPGWFIGFTGPGTAYGEVGFKTLSNPSPFFAGVLLDNVILEPDSTRILEKFIIYAGDWQDGISYWVNLVAKEFNVKPQAKSLSGYCSWYQKSTGITSTDIIRANTEFSKLPDPHGGRTIQIDDGFQIMPGNWGPNKKFEMIWNSLPKTIAENGSIPGLWLAPTAIHEKHPVAIIHPEMLQHLPNGENSISFSNWGWATDSTWKWGEKGDKTYFLEPDRPDSKSFMEKIMKKAVNEGWRYFKIDFTYPLSTARTAWNRKKTLFESYRDIYKLLRESSGPDVLINSCIGSIDRYPLGYVDIDRIGGDIGSVWNNVQRNLRDLLSRSCTNGYWWQADPDVFFMRLVNSRLSEEESFLLTGSVSLIGGVFITSDWPTQWIGDAGKAMRELWTVAGPRIPARHFVAYNDHNSIKAYRVSYNDGKTGPQHRLGIYNWSDREETMKISLEELRLKPGLKWRAKMFFHRQKVNIVNGEIIVLNQPPHSLRIIELSES